MNHRIIKPSVNGEDLMEYRGASMLITNEAVQDLRSVYNLDAFDLASAGIDSMLDAGAKAPFRVGIKVERSQTSLTITVSPISSTS